MYKLEHDVSATTTSLTTTSLTTTFPTTTSHDVNDHDANDHDANNYENNDLRLTIKLIQTCTMNSAFILASGLWNETFYNTSGSKNGEDMKVRSSNPTRLHLSQALENTTSYNQITV